MGTGYNTKVISKTRNRKTYLNNVVPNTSDFLVKTLIVFQPSETKIS